MDKMNFESIKVTGKTREALGKPIASAIVILITLIALFWWVFGASDEPKLISEIGISVVVIGIFQLCFINTRQFLKIAFTTIEYDREYLTIRSFSQKPFEIKLRDIDGFKIMSGQGSSGEYSSDSSGFKSITIRCNGRDTTVYEKWHTNFSLLEKLLTSKLSRMDCSSMNKRAAGISPQLKYYHEKLGTLRLAIDAVVLLLFTIMVLVARSNGIILSWITFIFPAFLIFRLAVGGESVYQFADSTWQNRISALCLAVYGLMQLHYIGLFRAGSSHARIGFELAVVAVIFLVGSIIKIFVLKEESESEFAAFFCCVIFAVVAVLFMKISTYGAGMVLRASVPTYENVEVSHVDVKSTHNRKYTQIYRIAHVIKEDGTEETYEVLYGAEQAADLSHKGRIKTYHSLLGYDVRRLEVEGFDDGF